jgi:hypothetical protein
LVKLFSEITQWIAPCVQDVSFNVHPKSDEKIDDDWRTHGKKRDVDEIFPDGRSSDAHSFTNGIANTEYMPFNKMFETLHVVKLKYFMLR